MQRVKTGGQINNSSLFLSNSVFTDFPDDSDIFLDNDNDALYLSASDATINNTVFMYAKDDGLDSGNIEGGEITITGSIFTNCGQGLELGFSSPYHFVVANNCMFLNNGIGILPPVS